MMIDLSFPQKNRMTRHMLFKQQHLDWRCHDGCPGAGTHSLYKNDIIGYSLCMWYMCVCVCTASRQKNKQAIH